MVLVGDRGMLAETRIRDEFKPVQGLDSLTFMVFQSPAPGPEAGICLFPAMPRRDSGFM